jgi:hypothetical protein
VRHLLLLIILLSLPVPISATTIVAVRTAKEINIGADSRLTIVERDGSVSYQDGCKIVQVGNIFSAAEGPFKGPGYDVESFLIKAHSVGGDIYHIVDRFSELYAAAWAKALQPGFILSPKQYERRRRGPINVYFFGFAGDTSFSLHRKFIYQQSPIGISDVKIQIEERDCPPGCGKAPPDIVAIGHFKDVSLPSLEKRSTVAFIREAIELSIKNSANESGPPVDIMRLTKQGGQWIQNEKGCPPPVQRY